MDKIRLNLASHPLRNKRFYRLCLVGLAALLILTSSLAVFIFVKYGLMHRASRIAVREIAAQMQEANSEEARFKSQTEAASKVDKPMVELLNAIIIRKSFSWTKILSELEGALPEPSYITSLAPSFPSASSMSLRIKVVSRSLDDLLSLINNLNGRNFKNIKVQNESLNDKGQFISEITFDYERTL